MARRLRGDGDRLVAAHRRRFAVAERGDALEPGRSTPDMARARAATGGARRMNQIDCAAEKSAIDAAPPSRKADRRRASPRAGRDSDQRGSAASATGARRIAGVHRRAIGAERLQVSGGARRKMRARPPAASCTAPRSRTASSRPTARRSPQVPRSRADRAAAPARGGRSPGTSATSRNRRRRRSA